MPIGVPITTELVEQIRNLYVSGAKPMDISRQLNVNHYVVYSHLKDLRPERHPKQMIQKLNEDIEIVIQELRNYVEMRELEKRYGLHGNTIRKILRQHGYGERHRVAKSIHIRRCNACNVELTRENSYPTRDRYCKRCYSELKKNNARKLKLGLIQKYGGECACCGNKEQEFLSINHLSREKKKLDVAANNGRRGGGDKLYRRLLNTPIDTDYNVLCMNCNCSSGWYGRCPHFSNVVLLTRNSNSSRRSKRKVLNAYGGAVCQCCNTKLLEFLTIDHIAGGGTRHREKERIRSIYAYLIRNNFPPGYRVLCMNCNSSLGFYGYCPHQTKTSQPHS